MNQLSCGEIDELLAAFATDALEEDDLHAVTAHLAECRNHDEALASLRATFEQLGGAVLSVEPPAGLKTSLLEAFDKELTASTLGTAPAAPSTLGTAPATPSTLETAPATPSTLETAPAAPSTLETAPATPSTLETAPATPSTLETAPAAPTLDAPKAPETAHGPPATRRLTAAGWVGYALAASLLLVVIGLGIWGASRGSDGDVLTRTTRGPDGTIQLTYFAAEGLGVIEVDLLALPAGRAYQAWAIDSSGAAASLGVLPTNQGRIVLDGDLRNGTAIALSVEPESGSSAPTTAPILLTSLE